MSSKVLTFQSPAESARACQADLRSGARRPQGASGTRQTQVSLRSGLQRTSKVQHR